jgi:BirA family biotin operon repressor/biotin-[acetyl-CoA-carboxylase] ligase
MKKMYDLIKILSDGDYHSGEVIGELLGVSRTAVWKKIAGLEKYGLDVESIKGKGYRLADGKALSLLNKSNIHSLLTGAAVSRLSGLDVNQIIESTNTNLMQQMSVGLESGWVCLAEKQTAGRGRRGRTWVSPYAGSVYLSVTQVFQRGAISTEGLSLAVGVLVAETLSKFGVTDIQLKWPNDIYWQGRKLAGILLELVGDAAGECAVVVGLGLNVSLPSSAADDIDQAWIDLQSILKAVVSRNELVAELLNSLLPALDSYEVDGFEYYLKRWADLDFLKGSSVSASTGDSEVIGIAQGVSERGALVIVTPVGKQLINGGEVSVRKA